MDFPAIKNIFFLKNLLNDKILGIDLDIYFIRVNQTLIEQLFIVFIIFYHFLYLKGFKIVI